MSRRVVGTNSTARWSDSERRLHRVRRSPGDVEQVAGPDVDHPVPRQSRKRLPDMAPIVLKPGRIGRNVPALAAVQLEDEIVAIVVVDDRPGAGLAPEKRGVDRLMEQQLERPGETLKPRRERDHLGYPDRIIPLVIGVDQRPEPGLVRDLARPGRRQGRADAVAIEPLRMGRMRAERGSDRIVAEQRRALMAGTARGIEDHTPEGGEKRVEPQRLEDALQDRLSFFDVHAATLVIPAKAGIQRNSELDSRFRGNDGTRRWMSIA